MKRKTVRPVVKAFRKAVSAFLRKARSMARRGYVIDDVLPEEPKKITEASVRRIKKISANLYKKSYYVTEEGEVISGEEGRKYERSRSAKKAAETRKRKKQESSIRYDWQIAIEWLYSLVNEVNKKGYPNVARAIKDIIDAAIVRTSERDVGLIVVQAPDDVRQTIQEICEAAYSADSSKYSYALSKLSQLLGGGALSAYELSEYESADEDGEYEYR